MTKEETEANRLIELHIGIENEYKEYSDTKQAIQHALITVNQIIKQHNVIYYINFYNKVKKILEDKLK